MCTNIIKSLNIVQLIMIYFNCHLQKSVNNIIRIDCEDTRLSDANTYLRCGIKCKEVGHIKS